MFNEEEHIERVILGFLASNYSNLVEILIADGGSSDLTREIVSELSKKDERVKLIENPEKFQSFGLNKMIEEAKGEVFLRADGHCYYDDNYLSNSVEVLQTTGARNVGGAQRYMAANSVQSGIALAVKSFFGNGGAKYMDETYEGYGDTVFLGCFRTIDLRDIGGFNTENITNQDSELNLRLIERFGECVFISPNIKSWYFPRESLKKLFKQYFRYGRGRFLTTILHPSLSPVRGLLPFAFMILLILYLLLDFVLSNYLYSIEVISLIAFVALVESFRIVVVNRKLFKTEVWRATRKAPGFIVKAIHTYISIIIMQSAHFLGFTFQLLKRTFTRSSSW